MKITVVLLALLTLACFSSCKDKKVEEIIEQKVEVVEIVEPEPVVAPPVVEAEVIVAQDNYYLVAGCFEVASNAEDLRSNLLNEGYHSVIIPFYNMSMVTYNGFETREDAQKVLNEMVVDPEKESVWIYPIE